MDLPILPVEEDRITSAVKRKGLAVMGGKTSNVYRDKSIRRKVYQGIYANLKYNFQIKTYRALKRSQVDKAIDIINNYQPPYVLAEQIDSANAQQTLIFYGKTAIIKSNSAESISSARLVVEGRTGRKG